VEYTLFTSDTTSTYGGVIALKTTSGDIALVQGNALVSYLQHANSNNFCEAATTRMIYNWLAVTCNLGVHFVESITEVSALEPDATDWKVVEWITRALHVRTSTCVRMAN
jgi:hypothetical protein